MPFFQSHEYTTLMLVSGIATAHNVQQVLHEIYHNIVMYI
jgi:hypothetical protein